MVLILSIETSDIGCSVALHSEGQLLASRVLNDGKSSSGSLTLLIQQVFAETKRGMSELSAVAVSKGPGSYTGLRIGVSTVKGICFGLGLPLISINSLDTLALGLSGNATADLLCPMLDARRMEVYCKLLFRDSFDTLTDTQSLILDEDSFSKELATNSILFCGPGSRKAQEVIRHDRAFFSHHTQGPLATNMGMPAYNKYLQEEFEDLIMFEPFYLKDFRVKKAKKKMPLDRL